MTRTLYALLVGINEYLGPVPQLHGCVNDVKRVLEFLRQRTLNGDFSLQPLLLTSGDPDNSAETRPTRQAVIDGFRTHLGQAGPDDIALFYYSGHGSQERAPQAMWHLEPDHLNETTVCYDSRTNGSWDLADKELAVLIAEVSKRQPHIVVILDACHSGSGTRAIDAPGIRLAPQDRRERPLESFEGFELIKALQPAEAGATAGADWIPLPAGNHIVLSACRAEQVAGERQLGGEMHGVLSYYLLDTLQRTGGGLTYRDVFARTGALVRNQVADQDPVIEASDVNWLQSPFLGGAVRPQPPYFALTHDKQKGWVIDGGAVHGIQPPDGDETTTLAVFPAGTDLATVKTMSDAVGTASVTSTEPGQSRVTLTLKSNLPPDPMQAYSALIVSQPLPVVTALLTGDAEGLASARQALATAGPGGTPSLIVREATAADIAAAAQRTGGPVAPETVAALLLTARDGRLLIRRAGDAYPLTVPIDGGYSASNAALAVQRLEHVARWLQIAQLDNKTSSLPPNAVSMEFYAVNADGSLGARLDTTPNIRMEYSRRDDKWVSPSFKLKLVNNTARRLYCVLLDLTETFAVQTTDLLQGGGEWLDARGQTASELWAFQGGPLRLFIPPELQKLGVITLRDIIKLIVSTAEINATLLELDELEVETRGMPKGLDRTVPKSALNRLMARIRTRSVQGKDPEDDETLSDWVASQVTLTTVRPKDQVNVPQPGEPPAVLSDGVSLAPHPALKAAARLTSMPDASRDVGNLLLPPALRFTSRFSQPFEFSSNRGGNPGLSVVELTLVDDASRTSVNQASPLTLTVQQPLAAHELILATAFDPATGLFLPVGVGAQADGGAEIQIYELPPPTSDSRTVQGSIKLCFRKIASDWLGLGSDVNRLSLVEFDGDGRPSLVTDTVLIAQKIQAAQRVLLYVHGFTGDTETMVTSAPRLIQASAQPTVVLAFDYENLNTTVEDTAVNLRSKLIAVGLKQGHTKQLHVIAHSLGTLVTRWLVEQVPDGKEIVQHAILVGGPNLGTPWARLEDLANFLMGAALNGLLALAGPVGVVPKLLSMLATTLLTRNKVIRTPDEIKPGAPIYQKLNDPSIDPHRPYTLIAGNIKQIDYPAAQVKSLRDLLARVNSPQTRQELVAFVFGGAPNDLVISVDSIRGVPRMRTPAPTALPDIACDHMTYFVSEVGLRALEQALAGTP